MTEICCRLQFRNFSTSSIDGWMELKHSVNIIQNKYGTGSAFDIDTFNTGLYNIQTLQSPKTSTVCCHLILSGMYEMEPNSDRVEH